MGTQGPRDENTTTRCAVGPLLENLTKSWSLNIVWILGRNGPLRFGALRHSIDGISARG